jgi:hypothetical protein
MNKIIIVILTMVMFVNTAIAETYIPIVETSKLKVTVDKDSLGKDNGFKSAVYSINYNSDVMPIYNNNKAESLDYYAKFDCTKKQTLTNKVLIHFVDGKEFVNDQSQNTQYTDIKYGGNTEAVYNYVCGVKPYKNNYEFMIGRTGKIQPIQTITYIGNISSMDSSLEMIYVLPVFIDGPCKNKLQCSKLKSKIDNMIYKQRPIVEIISYLNDLRDAWDTCAKDNDGPCEQISNQYIVDGLF